jgi:hypothetical protein
MRFSHAYDPTRSSNAEFFNLGNTGSAATPIIYEKTIFMGTDYGYHSYDPYRLSTRGFKFYETNRPFFDFTFTPVGGQQNFVIKTDFARPFADGMSLSLNYDRINQEGFYQSQDVLHTNFGLGIRYQSPNNQRNIFFLFKNEIFTENHNGGINERSDFSDAFSDERMSLAIKMSGGATRFQHRSYELFHMYKLKDSLDQNLGIQLESNLKLSSGYYKYADESVSNEIEFYGEFYVDSRGLRNYLRFTRINTEHVLVGNILKGLKGKIGIDYTHHRIDLEAEIQSKNDIFLLGQLDIPLSKSLDLNASSRIGLGSATGDFLISGTSNITLPKELVLQANISFYRNRHPLVGSVLYLNETLLWNNSLTKPFGSLIKAMIKFPFLKAQFGVKQSIENNTLFWNTSAQPELFSDVYSATVADLSFSFKLWKFNFDNYFAGQVFSENLFHLPGYYSKNQVYWESSLFKRKMLLRIGAEGRLIGPHDRIDYNPVTATFYQSEGQEDIYPFADAYIMAKVNEFRFFIRYENLNSHFDNRIFYQIGDYPQFDRKVRLGIKWQLAD